MNDPAAPLPHGKNANAGEPGGGSPPPRRAYDRTSRAEGAEGTRRRIAEAALALFKERDYDLITLAEIARTAGVSHQTVLNHFASKAGIIPHAVAVFSEHVRALQFETVPGNVASVTHTTCARYEALGDINVRWATMESRIPELVTRGLEEARLRFQSWLVAMLGELMPGEHQPEERRRVLLGLHASLDVFTWKLFRRDLGLSQEETAQQMTDLVLGVLSRHRIDPANRED